MKLSATEKRIYALAQKWAKARGRRDAWPWSFNEARARAKCGRALLKLLEKKR